MSEYVLKDKVRKHFEAQGWLVVFIMQTNKNGWPDIQMHRNGVTVFVETKWSEKKPRPLQILRHQQLKEQGFETLIITAINELPCTKTI